MLECIQEFQYICAKVRFTSRKAMDSKSKSYFYFECIDEQLSSGNLATFKFHKFFSFFASQVNFIRISVMNEINQNKIFLLFYVEYYALRRLLFSQVITKINNIGEAIGQLSISKHLSGNWEVMLVYRLLILFSLAIKHNSSENIRSTDFSHACTALRICIILAKCICGNFLLCRHMPFLSILCNFLSFYNILVNKAQFYQQFFCITSTANMLYCLGNDKCGKKDLKK